MKKKIYAVGFLILFCSDISFGQSKPKWIKSFENKIKEKESNWKIGKILEINSQNGLYDYVFPLTLESHRITIRINKLPDVPNRIKTVAEEMFADYVTHFDGRLEKNIEKVRLENFGEEGFIWVNYNKDDWTAIMFRKKDVFVTIYADSEETARKFAQYVLDEMPQN